MRKELAAIVLLTLLAYGLRAYHLDHFSFWLDEGLTPLRSSYSVSKILTNVVEIQGYPSNDTHPPLYYLLIHGTRQLFGTSDFAFRYPSLLFGVLLVPLLYQFGAALHSKRVGLLTALFATLNPQQIWYAQEARMYTQVVFLMTVAALIVWRLWQKPPSSTVRWLGWLTLFSLFGLAGALTHYTAGFLLITLATIVLILLWRERQWALIGMAAVGALAVAVPIVPPVWARLTNGMPETSYRLVPVQVFFLDIVRGFGLGRTVSYDELGTQLFFWLLAILLIWGIISAEKTRLLLLTYLTTAVFGLLFSSYIFKPIYLGAHHIMVGSPAFLLLLAIGANALPVRYIGALTIISAQLFSLNNFYWNPDYAKEDYRAQIREIEQMAGENDVVLYNNAVLMTLYQHYQTRDDLPFTALPVYPYAVGDEVAVGLPPTREAVQSLLNRHDRVWYISDAPPDLRDGERIVTKTLQDNAALVWQNEFHGRFAPVNYATFYAGESTREFEIEVGQNRPIIWVDLQWETDTAATLQLRDPNGDVWSEITALPIATQTTHPLQLPDGLPPATYSIWRDDAMLTTIDIDYIESAPRKLTKRLGLSFDGGIELVGYAANNMTTFPGNPLPLTLYWQFAEPSNESWLYRLIVTGNAGLLREDFGRIGADWINWQKIPAGGIIAQPIGIYPRPTTQEGRYHFEWSVYQETPTPKRQIGGDMTVQLWLLETTLPDVDNLALIEDNSFGNVVRLEAFALEEKENQLGLTLYWYSQVDWESDYSVFLHLVDSADAPPLAQSNGVPANSSRPTMTWRKDEIITDMRAITLPDNLPAGEYEIYIGFYKPDSGVRLPVTLEGVSQPFDQLFLTHITLP